MRVNACYLGTHYIGMVETNFLISTFAEYKEVDSFIVFGALFQSLVASPMNEFRD